MKTAIIISDGMKQIMFTPENKSEEQALRMITPDDDISIEVKEGTLYDNTPQCARGYVVEKCKADYLRAFECEKSLMLILKPKEKKKK